MSKIKVSVSDLKRLIARASMGDSLVENEINLIKKNKNEFVKRKRSSTKSLQETSQEAVSKSILEAVRQLCLKRPDSIFVRSLHEQVINQKQDLSQKQKDVVIKMLNSFDLADLAKEIK